MYHKVLCLSLLIGSQLIARTAQQPKPSAPPAFSNSSQNDSPIEVTAREQLKEIFLGNKDSVLSQLREELRKKGYSTSEIEYALRKGHSAFNKYLDENHAKPGEAIDISNFPLDGLRSMIRNEVMKHLPKENEANARWAAFCAFFGFNQRTQR